MDGTFEEMENVEYDEKDVEDVASVVCAAGIQSVRRSKLQSENSRQYENVSH